MDAKHTPGPWDDISSDAPNSIRIFAGNRFICFVGNSDEEPEQTLANARLIAAAPDLLEALKEARRFVECYESPFSSAMDDKWATQEQVNNAIAKAKGRAV